MWTNDLLELAEKVIARHQNDVGEAVVRIEEYRQLASDQRQAPIVIAKPSSSNAAASVTPEGVNSLLAIQPLYEAKLDADARTGERSEANADRHKVSIKQMIRFIADQPYDPDTDKQLPKRHEKQAEYFKQMFKHPSPVASRDIQTIGYDQLSSLMLNVKNRRVSGFAPDTILNMAQHVKQFLDWLEATGI